MARRLCTNQMYPVQAPDNSLPFVHDQFPHTKNRGIFRHCTRERLAKLRAISKKKADDTNRLPELGLSGISTDIRHLQRKAVLVHPGPGYVYKHNSYFKKNGIKKDQVYSLNRNKEQRKQRGALLNSPTSDEIKRDGTDATGCTNVSLPQLHTPVVSNSSKESPTLNTSERSRQQINNRLSESFTHRIEELISKSEIIDVCNTRGHANRKLGNIVPPERLRGMLDQRDPLSVIQVISQY